MRAALQMTLMLACVLQDVQHVAAQTVPVPSQGAQEPAAYARPQGAYATIDTRDQQAVIQRLGQLIPYERRAAIAGAVAGAPRLSPPALYALVNAMAQDDAKIPDAVFWFHVARIRAVYDALRCKDESARPVVTEFGKRLNPDVARYQRQHREHTLQIAELAIKWDQQNPRNYDHRWINMYGKGARDSAGTDASEITVPESEWPAILKHVHEAHLKSVREFAAQK
jgi:hypothetical protein